MALEIFGLLLTIQDHSRPSLIFSRYLKYSHCKSSKRSDEEEIHKSSTFVSQNSRSIFEKAEFIKASPTTTSTTTIHKNPIESETTQQQKKINPGVRNYTFFVAVALRVVCVVIIWSDEGNMRPYNYVFICKGNNICHVNESKILMLLEPFLIHIYYCRCEA
ncbi:CLUMA_CG021061, isoform A [Clunio marinus]|uniref:CLUMA_CG021061, isoform A n=1 Tax=Clunio marinus TaxID=568069 RepID=A0A1J1J8V9_9DIPT|nr:CLUMA_CG021061, isoform A [Clunio marinus]